jgi:glyoxylase-like metal-dependent hydrolase (beta-lactamase superfamily II)
MLCRIGEIEVWRVLDWQGLFLPPEELFPNAPEDVAQIIEGLAPRSICQDTGCVILPVQGFLLKAPSHNILVDTCVGNHKTSASLPFWDNLTDERFLAGLTAAGVGPADVHYVLCTHLHIDHIGWNTRLENGQWVPTFPNAKYLMPRADEQAMNGRGLAMYEESISPIIKAGQAEWVDWEHHLGDSVSLFPTPGHTMGHVSIQLRSGGQEAMITGDAIHSSAQCQHPHWHFQFDRDADLAVRSRRKLLETTSERGMVVLGTHFTLPSIGRIVQDGDVFRWEDI